jgi:hypothetical protein
VIGDSITDDGPDLIIICHAKTGDLHQRIARFLAFTQGRIQVWISP